MAIEIATAFVQVVPSMKGVGKAIESAFGSASETAGNTAGIKAGNGFAGGFGAKLGVITGIAQSVAGKAIEAFMGLSGEITSASDSAQKFASTLNFAGVSERQIKRLTASTQDYADKTVYDLNDIRNTTPTPRPGQLRRPTRCPTPGEPTRPLTWHPSRRCPMATASEVLRIAAGEIGYSRWTDPQPGTKYGRWYAQSHGSYYGASGVPFCAMFVSWVMSRAGQAFPGLPAAYVPYVLSAGRSRAVSTRSARPGDIVIFNWDGGVVDHIGFVEANHGSYIQTIEGNTNNGRVARRTRAWNTIAAILRPAYSGSATSSGGGTGRLTVDGSCGPATIRRWQQVMGTSVDGIISGQYRPDGRTWGRPALVDSCVRYGGGGSNLIRAVQRKLNLTADGLLGPATIRALQKHLGVAQDSWFGPGTARALQSRLNTGRF